MWLTDHVWLCCQASSGGQSGSSASTPPRYTIYVVEGSPHKASDLRRAGLERASAVVVLADKAAVQDIDEEVRTSRATRLSGEGPGRGTAGCSIRCQGPR